MVRKKTSSPLDKNSLNPSVQKRIENAVLDVLSSKPFAQVRFGEIAKAANTSLQTIYRYYGTKEALLTASFDRWIDHLSQRVTERLNGVDTYKERLRQGFTVVLSYFEEHPKVALLAQQALSEQSEAGDPLIKQQFSQVILSEIEKGQKAGHLNREVSQDILFDYFAGIFIRLVQSNALKGSGQSIAAQANILFELLWRAIANPENDTFSA